MHPLPTAIRSAIRVALFAQLLLLPALATAGEGALPPPTPPPLVYAPDGVEPSPPEPPAAKPGTPRSLVRVTLRDGQELKGELISQTPQQVVIALVSGGRMSLDRASIASVESLDRDGVRVTKTGEIWFADPNRTRYFYAPSAMRLRAGEAYFSQKELLFSAFGYGLTDNVSVLAGTVLPAWFVPNGYGVNFVGALKAGFTAGENFNLAAGVESLFLPGVTPSPMGGGFAFASVTYGSPDAHVTLSGGKPFYFGTISNLGDLLFVLAGNLRLSANVALVTENWILPRWTQGTSYATGTTFIDAVGGRFFGEHWAVDVGLIFLPTMSSGIPIPWLDFTYNFGAKKT